MSPRQLFGIVGPKRSGKDSVADVLVNNFFFQKNAFADFLKEGCGKMFMLDHDQLYGDHKETVDPRWNVTPRAILQVVGTDLFRNMLQEKLPDINLGEEKTLWCRAMRLFLEECSSLQSVVIPDVRFQDEADMIKRMGGVLIRVRRPGLGCKDQHMSEQEQANIQVDVTVENDGELSDLRHKVVHLLDNVLRPATHSRVDRPYTSMKGLILKRMPQSVEDLEAGEEVVIQGKRRQTNADDGVKPKDTES